MSDTWTPDFIAEPMFGSVLDEERFNKFLEMLDQVSEGLPRLINQKTVFDQEDDAG